MSPSIPMHPPSRSVSSGLHVTSALCNALSYAKQELPEYGDCYNESSFGTGNPLLCPPGEDFQLFPDRLTNATVSRNGTAVFFMTWPEYDGPLLCIPLIKYASVSKSALKYIDFRTPLLRYIPPSPPRIHAHEDIYTYPHICIYRLHEGMTRWIR